MTYGRMLERRSSGIYYYRQTLKSQGKQVVRRFSLRTRDLELAKFLSLQIRARIAMIDWGRIGKYEVQFGTNGQLQSVKTTDENDAAQLNFFLEQAHKREIEKLKLQAELLQNPNNVQEVQQVPINHLINAETSLKKLKDQYIEESTATENTRYKYNNFISKFIDFSAKNNIHSATGVDRKIVYSYLLHLRNNENKQDSTIKNIFNTLSTFYNHLIRIGEVISANPFVGQKLKASSSEREPFKNEEIHLIFSNLYLQEDKKLFYICLLLVTTGARPNEICQLWTDDIQFNDNFYTIHIRENKERDQFVKNKESERLIYLNEILVKFGFIEYLKSRPLGMIFDLKRPSKKTYSTYISETFSEFLKAINIVGKTMYCFRHTAISRMEDFDVKDKSSRDLVGHEATDVHNGVYKKKSSPERLKIDTEEVLQYKEIEFFSKLSY